MAAIKEAYVSFETAKLLKEKGFGERIIYGYIKSNGTVTDCCYCNIPGFPNDYNYNNTKITGHYVCAKPTLQMAMKWLREVHHVYLNINVRVILGQWSGYDISIHTTDNDGFLNKKIPIVLKDNTSYEQACEAAIQYSLKNLI